MKKGESGNEKGEWGKEKDRADRYTNKKFNPEGISPFCFLLSHFPILLSPSAFSFLH